MLIKKPADIRESEVTPKGLYVRRREFIASAGSVAALAVTAGLGSTFSADAEAAQNPSAYKFPDLKKGSPFDTTEALNSYKDVTTYNNFYEFGLDKGDPARYAHSLKPRRGRSPSRATAANRATTTSKTSRSGSRSRSASTACAASRRGRWSFPGSASRWPT